MSFHKNIIYKFILDAAQQTSHSLTANTPRKRSLKLKIRRLERRQLTSELTEADDKSFDDEQFLILCKQKLTRLTLPYSRCV
jgi:hypothetical protein